MGASSERIVPCPIFRIYYSGDLTGLREVLLPFLADSVLQVFLSIFLLLPCLPFLPC